MRRPLTTSPIVLAAATLSLCVFADAARSQQTDEARMMQALSAQPDQGIKGMGATRTSSDLNDALIQKLRQKSVVSLSVGERKQLDQAIAEKPKIDLEMDFDSKSDVLRGKSLDVAESLGRVLSSSALSTETFLVAGYTDAKGSLSANQALSQRRADAVKQFLIKRFGISTDRLISVGYGKVNLKNPNNPTARENRRVQVVNLKVSRSAEKKQ